MPSYSPVFSAQFIVNTPDTPVFNFAVPTGFTAVVRDITLYQTVGGVIAQVDLQNSIDAPPCNFAVVTADGIPGTGQWQGRVVVPENGFINLTLTDLGSSPHCYVGGYLLRNVAT